MKAEEYELALSGCKRWSADSLAIVKNVLLDGKDMGDVAKQFNVKPQQVRVLKERFQQKLVDAKIKAFAAKVPPAAIAAHLSEVKELASRGYTSHQIAAYLREQGIQADEKTIQSFLQGDV